MGETDDKSEGEGEEEETDDKSEGGGEIEESDDKSEGGGEKEETDDNPNDKSDDESEGEGSGEATDDESSGGSGVGDDDKFEGEPSPLPVPCTTDSGESTFCPGKLPGTVAKVHLEAGCLLISNNDLATVDDVPKYDES